MLLATSVFRAASTAPQAHHPLLLMLCAVQVLSVIDSEMVFGEPTYETFKFK